MGVVRLDHIVVTVSDLDEALAFYRDVVGLRPVGRATGTDAVTLRAGEQLLRLQTPARSGALMAHDPRAGSSDLCIETDFDPQRVIERLTRHDVPVVAGPVTRRGARGAMTSVYVRDPDGSLVELCSYGSAGASETAGGGRSDTTTHETMLQCFEWYLPADHGLWRRLQGAADELARIGFTMTWLPPAYKGRGGSSDVGYGVYDMYDLGEFDAKGSVPTKYGTRAQYLDAIASLHASGLSVIADIVFNHRMGGDARERVRAQAVDVDDRMRVMGAPFETTINTRYTFPARGGAYSRFTWNWRDFTGRGYTTAEGTPGIMRFEGKQWSDNVSKERGNFDYIMGDDVDFSQPEVVRELESWGGWYTRTTGLDGFRLDAVKSIDSRFFPTWLHVMRAQGNHPGFAVGEYWSGDVHELERYLDECGYCMTLFDVPLHFRFHDVSRAGGDGDLRTLFSNTLSGREPSHACAFVDNHDTQPGQALESWVEAWFKPAAYAFLLLRDQPYPCVFWGDLYGIPHDALGPTPALDRMVWVRRHLLGHDVVDLIHDDPHRLCWMVRGEHPVLVLMTNQSAASCPITLDALAGMTFVDICDGANRVTLDADGSGTLRCDGPSCAVFVTCDDHARMESDLR